MAQVKTNDNGARMHFMFVKLPISAHGCIILLDSLQATLARST